MIFLRPGRTDAGSYGNRHQTDCFEDFLTTGHTSLTYTTDHDGGLEGTAAVECLDGKPDPTVDDIPELFEECCDYLRWDSFK